MNNNNTGLSDIKALIGFPCETLCPITLYELGTWSILSQQTGAKLFVGCHPEYKRKVRR